MAELQGLDFPRGEVRLYLAAARKIPRDFKGTLTDIERARVAYELLLKKDEDGDPLPPSRFTDLEGLALTQAMLNELWRWRRRGGGMQSDDEIRRPHEAALAEIQEFKPEDIDRITSSLLDSLPITDAQKSEMSQGVQQVAVGAFQGAVWGSLVLALAFIAIFNFIRPGGG